MTNPMNTKEMSTLTRYDPDCYGLMLEDPTGEFIRHEDAEQTILALTARVEACEADAGLYRWIDKAFNDMKTSTSENFLDCLVIDGAVCKPLRELLTAALNPKDVTP